MSTGGVQPDLLVVGAAKAGSTTLTALLDAHPDVFMVPHEVHYFSDDERHARGPEWYRSLFDEAGGVRLRGENSNTYTMSERYPGTVERMAAELDLSTLRIVYLVRHPLHRLASHWIEKRSHGGDEVHHDFARAVRQDTRLLLDPSRYWSQLAAYRAVIDDDRIHVTFHEDLRLEPEATMAACFEFCGLGPPPDTEPAEVHLNPSAAKRVQRGSLSRLRRVPGYDAAVRLLPASARQRLRSALFFTGVRGAPEWDATTWRWAADQLGDDSARLLEHCGRPGLWDLSAPPPSAEPPVPTPSA